MWTPCLWELLLSYPSHTKQTWHTSCLALHTTRGYYFTVYKLISIILATRADSASVVTAYKTRRLSRLLLLRRNLFPSRLEQNWFTWKWNVTDSNGGPLILVKTSSFHISRRNLIFSSGVTEVNRNNHGSVSVQKFQNKLLS